MLVHRVLPEKTRGEGEMALGICAKGVIVHEVKNNSRIATLRFQWREIRKISTCVSVPQWITASLSFVLLPLERSSGVARSPPDQVNPQPVTPMHCGMFGRSLPGDRRVSPQEAVSSPSLARSSLHPDE